MGKEEKIKQTQEHLFFLVFGAGYSCANLSSIKTLYMKVSPLEVFPTPVDNMARKRSGNVACPANTQQD